MKSYYCRIALFLTFVNCGLLATAQKSDCNCCCLKDTSVMCSSIGRDAIISVKTVIYDFKTKSISFPGDYYRLRRGSAVQIKVVNYNPYLYQVNINGRDSSSRAIIDSGNLLAAFTSLANLSTIVAGLAPSSSPVQPGAPIQPFSEVIGKAKRLGSAEKTFCDLNDPTSIFNKNISGIDNFSSRFMRIKGIIGDKFLEWDTIFAPLRFLNPSCRDFDELYMKGAFVYTEYKKIQDSIQGVYLNLDSSMRQYEIDMAHYRDCLSGKGQTAKRIIDSSIRVYYRSAIKDILLCDSILNYKVLVTVKRTIDRLKDVKPCYTSAPIFLLGDSRIFSIGLKPWNDSLHLQTYAPVVFELPWIQRMIWGVSAGLYGSTLHNNSFAQSPVDSAHYQLVGDKGTGGGFGVDGLAYMGWKLRWSDQEHYSYLGFCFGAAVSLESAPKPRVMAGISYITGRINRLVFSGGIISGATEKLSNGYSLGTTYLNTETNYINKAASVGGFLSINYSFIN